MERLKQLNKEQIFFIFLLSVVVLDLIFLISSQATKEWYKGGDDGCEWKGNANGIYSSHCYSHKSYQDTKCSHSRCTCCSDQVDLDKLGHALWPFIVLIIFNCFWMGILTVGMKKKIDLDGYFIKLSKILTIPVAFLMIIFFAVESFGITHEKVQAGLVLRIISIIVFALFTVALCWLNNGLRPKVSESLFRNDVTIMSVLKGNGEMLVNKEGSFN
jgi:hypothetical protein